ncbi:MAG: hypothetical protein GY838_15980 [bacterium]|nr:hypothetical protein [bacterium]
MRSRKLAVLLGSVVLMAMLFAACSDDDDPATPPPPSSAEETIGATGGTLEIPNKLALEVPAGALTGDVDFAAEVNLSPPMPPVGYTLVSVVYTIEPSGTVFDDDVLLTLHYSESLLGGADEDDIVVFTDSGSGWSELESDVDADTDVVTTWIDHLSYFVAAVETFVPPTDVLGLFEVHRDFMSDGKGAVAASVDTITAAFRSGGMVSTDLRAESVTFGAWNLGWYGDFDAHLYFNPITPGFLTAGSSYDLVVAGDANVPALDMSVTLFADEPVLTGPAPLAELPLAGFEVTWNGTTAGGFITLVVEGGDGTSLDLDVINNGSYTFADTELQEFAAGPGTVGLYLEDSMPVTATGYDEESRVEIVTSHRVPVSFTRESTIAEFNGSRTVGATIPDGPSGGGAGSALLSTINVPASGAVDSVRVYLDITHTWTSDMIIRLRSPEGTELRVLFIGEGGEPFSNPVGWYPTDFTPKDDLNGFDGDEVNGNWVLDARDYSHEAVGTLNEWRLQIFYAE